MPAGFGGHHWRVVDTDGVAWFVTLHDYADERDAAHRGAALVAAFCAASAVADAGVGAVVAPVRARDGSVCCEVSRHRWLSLTPWLEAARLAPALRQSREDRNMLVDVLVSLHGATAAVAGVMQALDLQVRERAHLDRALAGTLDWGHHPWSDRVRQMLTAEAAAVERALATHDRLSAGEHSARGAWVVTHGEPHWRNVLVDGSALHLVDWDTARLAPAARDLWHVTAGCDDDVVDEVLTRYAARSGRIVTRGDLAARALHWDLDEVAHYVARFSRPHLADEDDATALEGLTEALASVSAAV